MQGGQGRPRQLLKPRRAIKRSAGRSDGGRAARRSVETRDRQAGSGAAGRGLARLGSTGDARGPHGGALQHGVHHACLPVLAAGPWPGRGPEPEPHRIFRPSIAGSADRAAAVAMGREEGQAAAVGARQGYAAALHCTVGHVAVAVRPPPTTVAMSYSTWRRDRIK